MQKALVVAITMASFTALASDSANAGVSTQTKQELTTLGAVTAGAAAAGPVGAVAGMLVSIWLLDELNRAGERNHVMTRLAQREAALDQAGNRVVELEAQLSEARSEQTRLAKSMLDSLELALMFRTGEAVLSDDGRGRVQRLGHFLNRNPDLMVRIHGFADPRGSADANMSLSKARAASVAEVLRATGLPSTRIQVNGYGETQAKQSVADLDTMALDRKVIIELSRDRDFALHDR